MFTRQLATMLEAGLAMVQSLQALAEQTDDAALAAHFAPLAKQLTENEQTIVAELAAVQGKPVDIGGYYRPDFAKLDTVMRPSATFNAVLASVAA